MNQEECLQIVRASTRARKYVMVQQEKSPSEPEKHNTEFVTEKKLILIWQGFYFLNENPT